jgi:hypothetical protein
LKIRNIITVLAAALLTAAGCTQYYMIFAKKSTFFTTGEREILESSLKAADMGSGYDPEYDLDYIYTYSHTTADRKILLEKISASISSYPASEITVYYEKIYTLYAMTMLKVMDAEKKADWRTHTYLKKYLAPGLDIYMDVIEAEALRRDGSYALKMELRKKEIFDSVREKLETEKRKREVDFD